MTVLLLSLNLGALPDVVPPREARLGFVPTAGDVYEDASFVRRDRDLLVQLGYDVVDIPLTEASADPTAALRAMDAVFLAGGNTFFLMQQLRLSGAADPLRALVAEGMPLIGASAGAVVAGPSLEPVRSLDDPTTAPRLPNDEGMHLVSFVPLPHAQKPLQDVYASIAERYGHRYDIVPLRDDEAIVVDSQGHHQRIESPPLP